MQISQKAGYDSFADFYDAWHDRAPQKTKADCVEMLAEIAGDGPALELAIGTGRIALPLSMKGVRVSGVDNSPGMLEKLYAKPGADQLTTVCGNFADVPLEGPFGLIYAVFSFGYLLTQAEQVRCFMNVKKRLARGGAFVIQTVVPGARIFSGSSNVDNIFDVPSMEEGAGQDATVLQCSKADLVQQIIDQRMIVLGDGMPKIHTDRWRYVWPSELDLMAQIAGLTLHARWGGWAREPFTSKSPTQVSVYQRLDA